MTFLKRKYAQKRFEKILTVIVIIIQKNTRRRWQRKFYHKEHKEHKEIFKTSRTSSAPPRLRVRFARALV